MHPFRGRRMSRPLAALAASTIVLAGCSVGSIGGGDGGDNSPGTTTISFLYQNDAATGALGKANAGCRGSNAKASLITPLILIREYKVKTKNEETE